MTTTSDGYYPYPAHQRYHAIRVEPGPDHADPDSLAFEAERRRTNPTEEEQNEERGDIGSALRDLGFEDVADDVDGCTIEDARAAFHEVVGVQWNWEGQKDKWTAQSMHETAAIDALTGYDPYGDTKHRFYEEN